MAETQTSSSDGGNEQLIALAISFFLPGIGQVYQGRTKEGAVFFVASIVAFLIGSVLALFTLGLSYLLLVAVWAVNLYDVYTEWLDL